MPSRRDTLDNVPFRDLCQETMVRTGSTLGDIAGWAGIDPEQLRRSLGLKPGIARGRKHVQRGLSYETAVKLVRACDAWPTDYGV